MLWFRNQLLDSPVLEHKTQEEHEDAKCPEDNGWRHFTILSVANPDPLE
jgi:hypothetical protein